MAVELTLDQRTAVENRGGSLLVSAAAGSGKTKVLVERLFRYIMEEQCAVDDFLIITYTKAAAAELRGKIAAELYDASDEKGTLKGSILATLQKKLVVNTTGVLFDLLGKCGDRATITAAGEYLSAALYTLLRHLYRRSGGSEDLFAADPVDFDGGTVDAAMLRSRAAYLQGLERSALPELSSDDLTAAPGLGQSVAQVLHNVDELTTGKK